MKQEWRQDICVADNVISPNIIDNFNDLLFSQLRWDADFGGGTSILDNSLFENKENSKVYEQFQFTCTEKLGKDVFQIGGDSITHLIYMPLLNWCLANSFALKYKDISRCKVNVQTRAKLHTIDKYNLPHIDQADYIPGEFAAIYYMNDSDGDTYFFKESAENLLNNMSNENVDYYSNLTFKSRVTPKKGRLVVFPINQVHAGSHPVDSSYRAVINYNFMIKYMPTREEKNKEFYEEDIKPYKKS
jgi:hypothetical protein